MTDQVQELKINSMVEWMGSMERTEKFTPEEIDGIMKHDAEKAYDYPVEFFEALLDTSIHTLIDWVKRNNLPQEFDDLLGYCFVFQGRIADLKAGKLTNCMASDMVLMLSDVAQWIVKLGGDFPRPE